MCGRKKKQGLTWVHLQAKGYQATGAAHILYDKLRKTLATPTFI